MDQLHSARRGLPSTSTRICGAGIASALALCCVPAALAFDTAEALAATSCRYGGTCLATVEADLDGDGKPDTAELVYDARTKLFDVVIQTSNGGFHHPLAGAVGRGAPMPSMRVRAGSGDLRCRGWTDGTVCGYPTRSDAPATALYVTGAGGAFVIYLATPFVARSTKMPDDARSGTHVVVVPALDGATMREKTGF